MNYPTMEEVEKADQEQLASWARFLPSSADDENLKILRRILRRFEGWTPELSKKIGWN